MEKTEWLFDHPKIYLLIQEILNHLEACKVCNLLKYISLELSKRDYDKDAEMRSAVLLAKYVINYMRNENTVLCRDIDHLEYMSEEIKSNSL